MASPSLDGSAVLVHGGVGNGTNITRPLPALTTSVANDLIVVFVAIEQNTPPAVSSVSSAHLTFTKRSSHVHPAASPNCSTEVWAARVVGTLSSEVITVTLAAGCDAWCIAAQAFQNVAPAKWDPNAAVPAVGDGTGGSTSVSGVSTTNPDDLLFGSWSFTSQPAPAQPSGWTTIASQSEIVQGGSLSSQLVAFLSVSAAQSGVTVTSGGVGNYAAVIDALTSDVSLLPAHFGVIVGA